MDKLIFEGLIEAHTPDDAIFPAVGFALQGEAEPQELIDTAEKILGKAPTHFYFDDKINGYVLWSADEPL
jgi:hypothetical protein